MKVFWCSAPFPAHRGFKIKFKERLEQGIFTGCQKASMHLDIETQELNQSTKI